MSSHDHTGSSMGCIPKGSSIARLEVPYSDTRSALEIVIDREGSLEPPAFQPPPDISFDPKILWATVVMPRSQQTGPKQRKSAPRTRLMTVRYTCLKAGITTVMVTMHIL